MDFAVDLVFVIPFLRGIRIKCRKCWDKYVGVKLKKGLGGCGRAGKKVTGFECVGFFKKMCLSFL